MPDILLTPEDLTPYIHDGELAFDTMLNTYTPLQQHEIAERPTILAQLLRPHGFNPDDPDAVKPKFPPEVPYERMGRYITRKAWTPHLANIDPTNTSRTRTVDYYCQLVANEAKAIEDDARAYGARATPAELVAYLESITDDDPYNLELRQAYEEKTAPSYLAAIEQISVNSPWVTDWEPSAITIPAVLTYLEEQGYEAYTLPGEKTARYRRAMPKPAKTFLALDAKTMYEQIVEAAQYIALSPTYFSTKKPTALILNKVMELLEPANLHTDSVMVEAVSKTIYDTLHEAAYQSQRVQRYAMTPGQLLIERAERDDQAQVVTPTRLLNDVLDEPAIRAAMYTLYRQLEPPPDHTVLDHWGKSIRIDEPGMAYRVHRLVQDDKRIIYLMTTGTYAALQALAKALRHGKAKVFGYERLPTTEHKNLVIKIAPLPQTELYYLEATHRKALGMIEMVPSDDIIALGLTVDQLRANLTTALLTHCSWPMMPEHAQYIAKQLVSRNLNSNRRTYGILAVVEPSTGYTIKQLLTQAINRYGLATEKETTNET